MTFMRKDVWNLNGTWNDTLLWYAKGVTALQARPITDRTSWRFLAAMHGFDPQAWQGQGYYTVGDPLASDADRTQFWQQCQHQTWYFLPWHRGYVWSFETIIRAAIVALGGPEDWALPYWNYSDSVARPGVLVIPQAFNEPNLPDGSENPLHVLARYGPAGDMNIVLTPRDVDLHALTDSSFEGVATGTAKGLGGPRSNFRHFNTDPNNDFNGDLEMMPHNMVHSLVGGQLAPIGATDPNVAPVTVGLMTNPDTAGLDPIFWLHHANIDRLWKVWLNRDVNNTNPPDSEWMSGPIDGQFSVPDAKGDPVNFAASDMLDTTAANLSYDYEDVSDPLQGPSPQSKRVQSFAATSVNVPATERTLVTQAPITELMGANDNALALAGGPVDVQVRLDPQVTGKARASFTAPAMSAATTGAPDRVFLRLENIRGRNDAVVLYVYVDLPPGANPDAHEENFAGGVSLFGVTKASRIDAGHGGNGLSHTLEITHLIDALHLRNSLSIQHLNVRIVPRTPLAPRDKVSIGRISLYRHGD